MIAGLALWPVIVYGTDMAGRVKKAVEKITLDQPGTKPFHLKAVLAPSFERDKDSGRTGQVEIWWQSPTRWRRDLRSPEFHQVEIVDGTHDWQKNEGDYFPEWLREMAVELIHPVPLEQVLGHVNSGQVLHLMGQLNIDWITNTGTAEVHGIMRSGVALREDTGQILYANGFGWGGEFKDYQSFHGRMVAHTVSCGSPEVTAKVVSIEDLGERPTGFFDAQVQGGDPQPLETILLDETTLRKNLLPEPPWTWPPLQDGVLEGNVTTEIVVDREGRVREFGPIVSENSAINEAGRQRFLAMRFKPFLVNGAPVQAMSQIMLPFKAMRPSGVEAFESARAYFERGRRASFPAFGNGTPYVLRADFNAGGKEGVEKGHYEDTWLSENQWRREATFDKSRYVRSRNGDKTYQLAEGPEVPLLQFVLRVLEPIPATDTFFESDWRIKRDSIGDTRAIRVLTGYESPEGKLDPEQARGYWFNDAGLLLRTYFNGFEAQRFDFQEFGGVKVAHHLDVLRDGHLAMQIEVTELTPAGDVSPKIFELKGYAWQRAFTSEVR